MYTNYLFRKILVLQNGHARNLKFQFVYMASNATQTMVMPTEIMCIKKILILQNI